VHGGDAIVLEREGLAKLLGVVDEDGVHRIDGDVIVKVVERREEEAGRSEVRARVGRVLRLRLRTTKSSLFSMRLSN
jgi:hypothetical protein